MSKLVHKFELQHVTTIELPVGSFPLKASMQGDKVQLWIEMNFEETRVEKKTFHLMATGLEIPDSFRYVDTILNDGYVCHVYEGRILEYKLEESR